MVDPAGVDIEGEAQKRLAHYRALQVPAGRAPAPGRIPLHLPRFACRSLAPDCKVSRIALALDAFDAALSILGHGAGQAPVIGDGRNIEIKPALQLVAMLVRDAFAPLDHRIDIFGGARVLFRLHIQPRQIALKILLIEARNVPSALALARGHALHLVLAFVGVRRQVADISDVDDMGELVALPLQRPPQRIGEHIGAHIADMLVVIDRRPAGIDARLTGVDGGEGFELAGERVEQAQFVVWGSVGHGRVLWTATGTTSIPSSLRAEGAAIQCGARAALDCRVASLLAMTGFTQTR